VKDERPPGGKMLIDLLHPLHDGRQIALLASRIKRPCLSGIERSPVNRQSYPMRTTLMPPRARTSPATPCRSHEGLPPLRYARLAPTISAISKAYRAPLTWKWLTSSPVSGAMIGSPPSST